MDWIGWLLEHGATPILAAVASGVASTFAVRRALQQFYQQRWWEQRFAAYRTLLEAIHDIEKSARIEWESITEQAKWTGGWAEELRKKLKDKAAVAHAEIERSVALGEFLFSAEMIAALEEFETASFSPPDDMYHDAIDRLSGAAQKLGPKARKIAREDLKLRE